MTIPTPIQYLLRFPFILLPVKIYDDLIVVDDVVNSHTWAYLVETTYAVTLLR